MATTAIWSKKRNGVMTSNSIRSAPCTIFSTTTLSPRQIANKAYTLGCKKLDRDDKRSKQKYHVRERLLINNTISKAEEVLNTRTRRTNRRVMAAEDEDEDSKDEFSLKKSQAQHHVSPLKNENLNEEEEEEDESHIPNASNHISSESNLHHFLHRDCRINSDSNSKKIMTSSPITTTI